MGPVFPLQARPPKPAWFGRRGRAARKHHTLTWLPDVHRVVGHTLFAEEVLEDGHMPSAHPRRTGWPIHERGARSEGLTMGFDDAWLVYTFLVQLRNVNLHDVAMLRNHSK